MVGFPKPDPEQLEFLIKFIRNNYSNFDPDEIEKAYDLYIKAKLDITPPDYVAVNAKTLEAVMNAYKRYRFSLRTQTVEVERPLSQAEKDENSRQRILFMYRIHKQGKEVTAFGGAFIGYLKRKGLIDVPAELWEEYLQNADRVINESIGGMTIKTLIALRGKSDVERSIIREDVANTLLFRSFLDMYSTEESLYQYLYKNV